MSLIPGIVGVAGELSPYDNTDLFALFDSKWGRGGWRTVADATARDAFGTAFPDRITKGMVVVLLTDNSAWQLNTATPVGSSADWTAFGAGGGISALTGDVAASGTGSVPATLATVNSNVGTFSNPTLTVNGKGLITAAASGGAGGGISIGLALALPNLMTPL